MGEKVCAFLRAVFYASYIRFVTKVVFLSFAKGCCGISVTEIEVEFKIEEC